MQTADCQVAPTSSCQTGAVDDQTDLLNGRKPHIGIITAYNDMLSAHQPYEKFPAILKAAIRQAGGTAQVAAGVPAMCDGVTHVVRGWNYHRFPRCDRHVDCGWLSHGSMTRALPWCM